METIRIGSCAEFKVNITFKSDQGIEPWDVTAAAGRAIIAVIKTVNAHMLAKYTIGLAGIDDTIEVIDAPQGQYLIRLESADSLRAVPGEASLEIKIFETNEDFINNQFTTIGEVDLCEFAPALTSKATAND